MKGKRCAAWALIVLIGIVLFNGCASETKEEESQNAVISWQGEPRTLTAEGEDFLVVPANKDCKVMLRYTYALEDANGSGDAVLWLENDGEQLMMDELASVDVDDYGRQWQVSQISLRAGDNVFSLSGNSGTITFSMELYDPEPSDAL